MEIRILRSSHGWGWRFSGAPMGVEDPEMCLRSTHGCSYGFSGPPMGAGDPGMGLRSTHGWRRRFSGAPMGAPLVPPQRCELCGRPGATVGCCLAACLANYHFMCARRRRAAFQRDKRVFCQRHTRLLDGTVSTHGCWGAGAPTVGGLGSIRGGFGSIKVGCGARRGCGGRWEELEKVGVVGTRGWC